MAAPTDSIELKDVPLKGAPLQTVDLIYMTTPAGQPFREEITNLAALIVPSSATPDLQTVMDEGSTAGVNTDISLSQNVTGGTVEFLTDGTSERAGLEANGFNFDALLAVGTNEGLIISVDNQGTQNTLLTPAGIGGARAVYTDGKPTKTGWEYGGDYVSDLITNDRSLADVGTVKELIINETPTPTLQLVLNAGNNAITNQVLIDSNVGSGPQDLFTGSDVGGFYEYILGPGRLLVDNDNVSGGYRLDVNASNILIEHPTVIQQNAGWISNMSATDWTIEDQTVSKLGLQYVGDNVTTLKANDRSLADVGTVKQLIADLAPGALATLQQVLDNGNTATNQSLQITTTSSDVFRVNPSLLEMAFNGVAEASFSPLGATIDTESAGQIRLQNNGNVQFQVTNTGLVAPPIAAPPTETYMVTVADNGLLGSQVIPAGGTTPNLQDVLNEGSTATIAAAFSVDTTGAGVLFPDIAAPAASTYMVTVDDTGELGSQTIPAGGGGLDFKAWYVNPAIGVTGDGSASNPFLTIEEAITAAANNDIIYVGPGFYNVAGAVTWDKNLTFIGVGNDPTVSLQSGVFAQFTSVTFDNSSQAVAISFQNMGIGLVNIQENTPGNGSTLQFVGCFGGLGGGTTTIDNIILEGCPRFSSLGSTINAVLIRLTGSQVDAGLTGSITNIVLRNSTVAGDVDCNQFEFENSAVLGNITYVNLTVAPIEQGWPVVGQKQTFYDPPPAQGGGEFIQIDSFTNPINLQSMDPTDIYTFLKINLDSGTGKSVIGPQTQYFWEFTGRRQNFVSYMDFNGALGCTEVQMIDDNGAPDGVKISGNAIVFDEGNLPSSTIFANGGGFNWNIRDEAGTGAQTFMAVSPGAGAAGNNQIVVPGGTTFQISGNGGAAEFMQFEDVNPWPMDILRLRYTTFLNTSVDPVDPNNDESVMWLDNAGDLKIKINVGGTTKTATIVDYSALP